MALTSLRSPVSHWPQQIVNLADIPLETLQQQGIQGLILDLDNTIISEDDHYLSPGAIDWLQAAQDQGLELVILSNSSRRFRIERWGRQLGIAAIARARKPFPQAFQRALAQLGLKRQRVVVIGDSFHTDRLGAALMGMRCIQVASLPHPPLWWEYWLGSFVHRPYPESAIADLVKLEDWDAFQAHELD
jgi:uncharacterized protein